MNIDIISLLKLNKCTVLKSSVKPVEDGNSIVYSLPQVSLGSIFTKSQNVQFSSNFVRILGHQDEPMHHHISHVVAVILSGSAYVKTDLGDIAVGHGDVVVVPRGVKHEFICADGKEMDYMAYEVSNTPLDFLKHFND